MSSITCPYNCPQELDNKSDIKENVVKTPTTTTTSLLHENSPQEWEEVEYALDGGWAWAVAFASLAINFIVDGVCFSYGVLTRQVTEQGSLTEFQFHLTGSVMLGTSLTIGPLVALLTNRWGNRRVSVAGSMISSLGFFLCWAWSPNVPSFLGLLLGFGVLVGVGFGLMFLASIVVLGKFFLVNLPLATGIATTGGAIGSMIMPQLLGLVMKAWGWQGSFLFLSVCCLISSMFGLFFTTPPKRVQKKMQKFKMQDNESEIIKLLDLMTSPTFWVLSVAGGIFFLGQFVPSAFLAERAMGPPFFATEDDSIWLLAIIGVSNTIGRIIYGILSNSNRAVYSLLISNGAFTVGGLATVLSVHATEYWMLAFYAFILGQVFAVFAALRSVIVYQLIGKDKFDLAFGLSLFFMGIALYFGNSFASWLKDSTGDYNMTFYYTGAFFIISGLMCYPLPWIHRNEVARKPKRFSVVASDNANTISGLILSTIFIGTRHD